MFRKKRNWNKYNQKLENYGRISVWIDKDLLKSPFEKQKGRGRPKFSDKLLIAALCLRYVYSLPLRALSGFLKSLIKLSNIEAPLPHYSLYSKRMASLKLPKLSRRKPFHLLVDASGVKVAGEGEWKVKIHGAASRRKWLKLHIGVDENSQEIIALKLSSSNTHDSKAFEPILSACPSTIKRVSADGAYDALAIRKLLHDQGIDAMILPSKNGRLRKEKELEQRNDFLRIWKGFGGNNSAKKLCKKLLGYNRRSLVETAFSRFKALFGGKFRGKRYENNIVEALLKAQIMNKMAG